MKHDEEQNNDFNNKILNFGDITDISKQSYALEKGVKLTFL